MLQSMFVCGNSVWLVVWQPVFFYTVSKLLRRSQCLLFSPQLLCDTVAVFCGQRLQGTQQWLHFKATSSLVFPPALLYHSNPYFAGGSLPFHYLLALLNTAPACNMGIAASGAGRCKLRL